MRRMAPSPRFLLLLGASLAAFGAPAQADGPTGGAVVRGKAAISQNGGRTVIRQRTNRAVINWKGFDVGRDEVVVFDQPGKSSATLNRVNSAKRSVIRGALRAPGTIVIQNRAGVIFTESARIDAGGMVAASQHIDAERFERDGGLAIAGAERPGARVVNAGRITVRDAGLAALVGSDVENSGAIVAQRGTVALASGARATIDFAGDGVFRIAVDGDAPGAEPGVLNRGIIDVGDGRVVLSAGAAATALDAAINTTGVIRARSAHGDGGRIKLTARGAGAVRIAGAIDASGGRRGGEVTATGAAIEAQRGARIDARGGLDGGRVRLGGDRQGEGPLRRAERLRFDAGAGIAADGAAGRGGSVVLWSDGVTLFDGAISATGRVSGGFVETSGRFALDVGANGSVAVGAGGSWLLDPRDISIGTGGLTPVPAGTTTPPPGNTVYAINRLAIISTLNAGGDVTISTVQPGSTMAGDITVAGPIAWTGDGSLRLEAERDIGINAAVTVGGGDFTAVAARDIRNSGAIAAPGAGGVTLDAGGSVVVNQNIRATGSGAISLRAGAGSVLMSELRAGNLIVSTDTGDLGIHARDGAVELRRIDPTAGSNIQVFSNSGDIDISAGFRILLEGGAQGGRWVRLGDVNSSSNLTLTTSRLKLRGGEVGNTFAEIVSGPGGSISVDASERIWVHNGAGDQARIQTTGGSPLTLLAPTQIWEGPVRAGNGARNGDDVVIAGAISASFEPQFSLEPGASFTFRPAAPDGTPSSYVSDQPFVVTTSGTGSIEIGAPVTAQQITLESEERVGLGPRGRLTATDDGDALVVAAGRRFRNDATAGAGAFAVTGSDARWLLYLDAFDGLTGPAPAPRDFDLYGRTYDGTPPSLLGFEGHRIVYAERPTLTITADTLAKTYGVAAVPGYSVSGLRVGDSLATALDAGPTVSSAGAAADADAGAYATRAAAAASNQGYVLVLADGALTVDPARLTVRADDKTRTYGAANPTLTASVSGFVLGQDLADLDGALTLATSATRSSDVGTYRIAASGLTSGNYAITYEAGALTVDPARLTVTPSGTRTYGSLDTDFDTEVTGFVLGQDIGDLDGALVHATPVTRASDAGTYALTASGLSSGNYAITYETGALTIDPALLTIRADDKSRTYGAANPTLTASASGFVLGQDLSDLDGALALATTATRQSDVGTYRIAASGLTSGNYAITYEAGALTVDPARLTIRADDKTRTYGAANPPLTATSSGFVLGQNLADLDGALTLATGATRSSDVGTYRIAASGLTSGNYDITYEAGAMTVDPARLTVTPSGTRTYGSLDINFDTEVTGFVLGQDIGDLDGALVHATSATRTSDAGTYALTASGLSSGNYAITYETGALIIDPALLTIRADDKRRTYGSANPTLTATASGFVLGQDLTDLDGALTLATGATQSSDVGAYRIAASGLTSGNYAITYEAGALTVDPARLTVRADDKTRTYGASNPALTATSSGFVLGQDMSDLDGALTLATSATRSSDVGAYRIAASGLSSGNYAITYEAGALTVDPARLTIRADDKTRTYGAANPPLTATSSGFVLGQDLSDLDGALTLATGATRSSDVGAYRIAASGLTSNNYAITYEAGALTVDPAQLTIRADDKSRTYGAANPTLTASASGFVLGQDLADLDGALTLATGATQSSDVGAYRITASGLTSGNYAITYEAGALTVDPARLTIRADDKTRTYGAANPMLTASGSGFVLGQDLDDLDGALTLATTATRASDVGAYRIAASGLTSGNYAITYGAGALTVDPARLTVTPSGTRTYGSLDTDFDTDVTGFVLGQNIGDLDGALVHATPATRTSDAGTYALTASGLTSGNYAITYEAGALIIDPARLTIRADDAQRLEGQANPRFTASYDGFVLGQDAGDLDGDLALTTAADRDSAAGRYAIAASGLTSGNYAITYEDGLLLVRSAPAPTPVEEPQVASLDQSLDIFGRGAPPYTPGDSAFRTTAAEAPPSIDSTFALTYSLGEIAQLAPSDAGGADTGGFAPASGGGGDAPETTGCSGPVAPATPQSACVLRSAPESFWTTAFQDGGR